MLHRGTELYARAMVYKAVLESAKKRQYSYSEYRRTLREISRSFGKSMCDYYGIHRFCVRRVDSIYGYEDWHWTS